MILQRVIKGIGGINKSDADAILQLGIQCNWWRNVGILPYAEVRDRLTDRYLHWHQNRYEDPDPNHGNTVFCQNTPFISTTAGTVERDAANRRHIFHPAWQTALHFATDGWRQSGYLFYCYLFVLGRPSIAHQVFSEEIRELNLYTAFSTWQPEGEITAKIVIPSIQIEKYEYYEISAARSSWQRGTQPIPQAVVANAFYRPTAEVANLRDILP
jgi:hypothetical protein